MRREHVKLVVGAVLAGIILVLARVAGNADVVVLIAITVGALFVLSPLIYRAITGGEKERREMERMLQTRQRDEERRKKRAREEQERAEQIEALLQRDVFRDSVDYMTGVEFENFMANVFVQKGYAVQTTPASGDQGVDLLVDVDERKVAVQLKRYTAPVGNVAVAAVVAGMFHYKAREAWVITTSTFTKSARQLAKSNHVRLIDRKELEDWLSDLREET